MDVPPDCPNRPVVVLPPLAQPVNGAELLAEVLEEVLRAPPVAFEPPDATMPPWFDLPDRVEPPTELSSTTTVPPHAIVTVATSNKAHRTGQSDLMRSRRELLRFCVEATATGID